MELGNETLKKTTGMFIFLKVKGKESKTVFDKPVYQQLGIYLTVYCSLLLIFYFIIKIVRLYMKKIKMIASWLAA